MEGSDLVAECVDSDSAPIEPFAENLVITAQVSLARSIVPIDDVG